MKYLSVKTYRFGPVVQELTEMHESESGAIEAAKWKFDRLSVGDRERCTVEAWQVQDHIFVKDEYGNEIPGAVCCIIWSSEESE